MAFGALGDVLSDAGLGLMKGLMGPSWEDEKRARARAEEKAILENRRLKSQTALDEARALYEARRKPLAGRLYKVGNNLGQWNEEKGEFEVLYEGPEKALDAQKAHQADVRKAMETFIGHPPPYTYAELRRPEMIAMTDMLNKSPDVMQYGGEGGGIGSKVDIREYLEWKKLKDAGKLPVATPGTSQSGGAPAATAPRTTTPVQTEAAAPISSQPAPPSKTQPSPAGRSSKEANSAAYEQSVQVVMPGFEAMKDEDLEPAIVGLRKRQKTHPSTANLVQIEAAERVLAKRRDQKITQPTTGDTSTAQPTRPTTAEAPVTSTGTPPRPDAGATPGPPVARPEPSETQKERTRRENEALQVSKDRLRLEQQNADWQRDFEQQKIDAARREADRRDREPTTKALGETMKERLSELDKAAFTATKMEDTFGIMENLITSKESVYGNSREAALRVFNYTWGLAPGDQRARQTVELRNYASLLTLAYGSLGSNVSNEDRETYARAQGNMQAATDVKQMLEHMQTMRSVIKRTYARANFTRAYVEKNGRLPAVGEERVVTEADIQKTMANPKYAGKSREQVIELMKKSGFSVPAQ